MRRWRDNISAQHKRTVARRNLDRNRLVGIRGLQLPLRIVAHIRHSSPIPREARRRPRNLFVGSTIAGRKPLANDALPCPRVLICRLRPLEGRRMAEKHSSASRERGKTDLPPLARWLH